MATPKEQASPKSGDDDTAFSLSGCTAIATLPATDIERARRFYSEKLGLTPTPGAASGNYLYRCGATSFALRETTGKASGTHDQLTLLVTDLDSVVRHLRMRGVVFAGDIVEDGRTRTAWFKDSEGNGLMVREILACPAPTARELFTE